MFYTLLPDKTLLLRQVIKKKLGVGRQRRPLFTTVRFNLVKWKINIAFFLWERSNSSSRRKIWSPD